MFERSTIKKTSRRRLHAQRRIDYPPQPGFAAGGRSMLEGAKPLSRLADCLLTGADGSAAAPSPAAIVGRCRQPEFVIPIALTSYFCVTCGMAEVTVVFRSVRRRRGWWDAHPGQARRLECEDEPSRGFPPALQAEPWPVPPERAKRGAPAIAGSPAACVRWAAGTDGSCPPTSSPPSGPAMTTRSPWCCLRRKR